MSGFGQVQSFFLVWSVDEHPEHAVARAGRICRMRLPCLHYRNVLDIDEVNLHRRCELDAELALRVHELPAVPGMWLVVLYCHR
jgi:hypothetical protein